MNSNKKQFIKYTRATIALFAMATSTLQLYSEALLPPSKPTKNPGFGVGKPQSDLFEKQKYLLERFRLVERYIEVNSLGLVGAREVGELINDASVIESYAKRLKRETIKALVRNAIPALSEERKEENIYLRDSIKDMEFQVMLLFKGFDNRPDQRTFQDVIASLSDNVRTEFLAISTYFKKILFEEASLLLRNDMPKDALKSLDMFFHNNQ